MPVKPFPLALVKRLRALVKYEVKRKGNETRAYKLLGRMVNVDSRAGSDFGKRAPSGTFIYPWRVRELNVSKCFPETKVVIKRTHEATALRTISFVNRNIKFFNSSFPKAPCRLLRLPMYAIGERLVAMPKVIYPTIKEVLGEKKEAREFLEKLGRKHGLTLSEFERASVFLRRHSYFFLSNVLLVGYKKGQFLFMPLAEIK